LNTFGEKNLRGIQKLEGESEEGPWEILLLPMLRLPLVETSNLHGRRERWKERGGMAFTVLGWG
jgi:hypothetical protein